jgi:hypothetical protein
VGIDRWACLHSGSRPRGRSQFFVPLVCNMNTSQRRSASQSLRISQASGRDGCRPAPGSPLRNLQPSWPEPNCDVVHANADACSLSDRLRKFRGPHRRDRPARAARSSQDCISIVSGEDGLDYASRSQRQRKTAGSCQCKGCLEKVVVVKCTWLYKHPRSMAAFDQFEARNLNPPARHQRQ